MPPRKILLCHKSNIYDEAGPFLPPPLPPPPPNTPIPRPIQRRAFPAVEPRGRMTQYPTSVIPQDTFPDDHYDYPIDDGGFMETRERAMFRMNSRVPNVGNFTTGFQQSGLGEQDGSESLVSEDINEDHFDNPPALPPRPNRNLSTQVDKSN